MNKLNPFYLLLTAVVLFVISLTMISSSQKVLENEKQNYKTYLAMANEYHKLKQAWQNKIDTEKKIDDIIQSIKIKNAQINKSNKSIKIEIKNADIKQIDKFLNKLLNETVQIKQLSFSDNLISLEVGY